MLTLGQAAADRVRAIQIIIMSDNNESFLVAGIEGGGTTWVAVICSVSSSQSHGKNIQIIDRAIFNTEIPAITLSSIREWLRVKQKDCNFSAIGIASFGPIDARRGSNTFGYITTTPKPFWGMTDVVGMLGLYDEFKELPFRFDTDVNAPAVAEFNLTSTSTSAAATSSAAYVTVGTGIGVGLVVNNLSVKGLLHPEAGHIEVKRFPGDTFEGCCPFHQDCIEGMCSSGALASRAGLSSTAELAALPDDHPVWSVCAYYLAQLCVHLILIASPERIVLGGGVLNRHCLYAMIREQVRRILNGYVRVPQLIESEDKVETSSAAAFIGPSFWGPDAGIIGAAYLAVLARTEGSDRT